MAKDRKAKKNKANASPIAAAGDYEEEKLSSKILLFIVTLFIIAIWLGIIALLIKTDVGGFGSSVLYPVLKDVPYVNVILPDVEPEIPSEDELRYPYTTVEEAIEQIKLLERELAEKDSIIKDDSNRIALLQEDVADLMKYKDEQVNFELLKEKFYEEVVFGDEAPDIEQYKIYYESIDPENAEVLYKQVVEQTAYNDEIKQYVQTYSSMKAKNAAAIFDEMTDNFSLVADILENMDAKSRADILAQMDTENAARITKILEPRR